MSGSVEIRPEQSLELLKELHILTRDGKLNQDSRRKLKQVYHLYHFIEPLLDEVLAEKQDLALADHGAAGRAAAGDGLLPTLIQWDVDFDTQHPARVLADVLATLPGEVSPHAWPPSASPREPS